MPVIEVADLVKEFSRPTRQEGAFAGIRTLLTREQTVKRAVDGVNFTIRQGEMVGYLGPNGAGKSTTIKMLTGILVPTSGTVTVAGATPWRDRSRNARRIGVVFGQRSQLWWDLPLRDSLWLISRLYDVPEARFRERQRQFGEVLGLGPFLDTPVRQLSLGQRMRGDLAAAMLYDPDILYLDEPTVGLDVIAKERIRTFVGELNRTSGTTVVLTTHDLDDVEELCDRIILIDHGKVAYDGAVDELKSRYAPHRELVVQTDRLESVEGAEVVRREGGKVWLRFDPVRTPPAELVAAVLAQHRVTDLSIVEPELESVIHRIYADRG
ncbi:ABC transporter ATP-binding protein [Streptomyces cyaneofuscatus]|uniref:ABC transporter ATP-binding protein n=1 Tax=Streptomyces cyaneofuscatus TaxID=66883 RepID=UPI0033ACAAB5